MWGDFQPEYQKKMFLKQITYPAFKYSNEVYHTNALISIGGHRWMLRLIKLFVPAKSQLNDKTVKSLDNWEGQLISGD